MNISDLSSLHIGKEVYFIDEAYNNENKRFEPYKYNGKIDSLLIDINFGAYGYSVKFSKNDNSNFILKNENTSNLIGIDLQKLNFN